MDENIYTITLSDGTKLENLRLNGNNYISSSLVDPTVFENRLSSVVISGAGTEERHLNMRLVQCVQFRGESWFILRDSTAEEMWKMKMESDLIYLAMMTDVAL